MTKGRHHQVTPFSLAHDGGDERGDPSGLRKLRPRTGVAAGDGHGQRDAGGVEGAAGASGVGILCGLGSLGGGAAGESIDVRHKPAPSVVGIMTI